MTNKVVERQFIGVFDAEVVDDEGELNGVDDPRVDPTGTPMSVTGEYNPKIYPLEQIRYPLTMTNLMTAL